MRIYKGMSKEDIYSIGIRSRLVLNDRIGNLEFILFWSVIENFWLEV